MGRESVLESVEMNGEHMKDKGIGRVLSQRLGPVLLGATLGMMSGTVLAADVRLSTTRSDGRIDLSWTVSGDLRYVQVMRDTDGDPSGRQRVATGVQLRRQA